MTISQYGYVIQLCIELFGFIGFCKSENWKWTWNGCWWNPQKDGFQQQHVRSWTSKNDDFTLFSRQKKNVLDLDPKSIFLTTERFPDPPATPCTGVQTVDWWSLPRGNNLESGLTLQLHQWSGTSSSSPLSVPERGYGVDADLRAEQMASPKIYTIYTSLW